MKNILKYTLLASLIQTSSLYPASPSIRKNIDLKATSEAESADSVQNNSEFAGQQESEPAQQKKSPDDKDDFAKKHPWLLKTVEAVLSAILTRVLLRYMDQRAQWQYEQAAQALYDKNQAAINNTQRALERSAGFCEEQAFSRPIIPVNVTINSADKDPFTSLFEKGWYDPVSATIKDGQALFLELYSQGGNAAEKVGECISFLEKIHFEKPADGYNVRTHPVEYFKDMTVGVIESMGKLLRIAASSEESVPFEKTGRIFFSNLEEQRKACDIYKQKMNNIVAVFQYMPFSQRSEVVQRMQAAVIEQKNIIQLFKGCLESCVTIENLDLASPSTQALCILVEYEQYLTFSVNKSIERLQEDLMKEYRSTYA